MDVWAIVDHDIRGKWTDGERMSRAAGPGLALPPLLSSSSSSLSMRRHSRTQGAGLSVSKFLAYMHALAELRKLERRC
ncbi:hypothetical protein BDA96_01G558300 [Sorghum bicolor]|uniref:Uncharacterized protein n=1 Tax=Sorghum bicolor TaxID=4558 RepID=A0A921S7L9_SORBI|nr:hypothetical protein BDA96_01G558300 [Sorghum bicolor]